MDADRAALRVADAIEIEAWIDLYAAAPPAIAATLGLAVIPVADSHVFAARAVPMAMFNRCVGLGNERDVTEEDLDGVLAALRENANVHTWVQHGPASGATDLPAWLERRGFCPTPSSWLKLVREREPPPGAVSTSFDVREIGREHARAFGRTLADAHGMPPGLAAWTEAAVGRPGWRAYAAFDGDVIAAGGMLFVSGDRAWIGLGGTIAAYRERGAQGAIMSMRIADAISAGCSVLATETGERAPGVRAPAYANMLRAGFRVIAKRKNYERV